MWFVTGWKKSIKLIITFIIIGIPILAILMYLLILIINPKSQVITPVIEKSLQNLPETKDVIRRDGIQKITTAATYFCIEQGRCPSNLEELKSKDYLIRGDLQEIPVDPETKGGYFYQVTEDGKGCVAKAKLSTGEDLPLDAFMVLCN